jgi:hypothetical protein
MNEKNSSSIEKSACKQQCFTDTGVIGHAQRMASRETERRKEMVREALEEITSRGERTMNVLPTGMKTNSEQFGESKAE